MRLRRRWAYEAENSEIIDMLKAAGCQEDWTDRDGNTAATVGSEMPGELTKWAEEKRKKDAEEAAKREAEMAAAAAAAQAAGPDEPDYDDDWDDDEVMHPIHPPQKQINQLCCKTLLSCGYSPS
eukprot:SAG31_NODE_15716_length_741_cov_1.811526_1_plen_124_part_00